ncbi:XrtA/PEP-CTERM system histidine kinase PrsK [Desulfonema limicola]|uniref:XrtA/PEP-CTERM system histidine kinase PrsK n=1 Tax=Desulfonema limicola TaxID=45656 RepID=UPI001A9B8075|nr:XrtA/PEP-CTERM system histidine kinase PrsK [Desulfonema limicola]
MISLPCLAGQYLFFVYYGSVELAGPVIFSESVFALIWIDTAYWLKKTVFQDDVPENRYCIICEIFLILVISWIGICSYFKCSSSLYASCVIFPRGPVFFISNLIILISAAFMAWQMENFWRSLSPKQRWEYKFLAAGAYLICAAFAWAVSYRFTYHQMPFDYFILISGLLIFAWLLMMYAVIKHRLLNRKIYVSRKIVYAFVAPLVLGLYLIIIGLIAFIMQLLNLPFPVVLRWLLAAAGIVAVGLVTVSGKVRHSVRYFISTNFYINKYEYRDEWLDFSRLLQDALTEMEIVHALHEVMAKSLYTNIILIWLGDEEKGYELVSHKGIIIDGKDEYRIAEHHPLFFYLKKNYYYAESERKILELFEFYNEKIFSQNNIVLFVPLSIGDQMAGILGLGPEFTGGKYGQDDFDLLSAIGTQAASALLAARMAKKNSELRQQEAWDVMSAFILHDIKNAASMLSLLRQNAQDHIHKPEFQADMLDTVDDALKRMNKVKNQLSVLKREIVPIYQDIDLCKILRNGIRKLEKRLQGLQIGFSCPESLTIKTDPELLMRIMENILLNALEAGASLINIKVADTQKNQVSIIITDNGPGLDPALLPDKIFAPFKTTKPSGSGIGLWQVKRLVTILGGYLTAENSSLEKGARFIIKLPLNPGAG